MLETNLFFPIYKLCALFWRDFSSIFLPRFLISILLVALSFKRFFFFFKHKTDPSVLYTLCISRFMCLDFDIPYYYIVCFFALHDSTVLLSKPPKKSMKIHFILNNFKWKKTCIECSTLFGGEPKQRKGQRETTYRLVNMHHKVWIPFFFQRCSRCDETKKILAITMVGEGEKGVTRL